MARRINRLNDKFVSGKRPGGYYPDGNNLYLQVGATGSKSWLFRYGCSIHGKEHEMGLGAYPTFSLVEARERANKARQQLADGNCPLKLKQDAAQTKRLEAGNIITFAEAAEEYIKLQSPSWTNAKHPQQWRTTLETYAFPVLGKLPVHRIDNTLVAEVLEPIWLTKRETAERVQQRIGSVMDWCKAKKYRSGDNPADKVLLKDLLPKTDKVVVHQPALPFAEIGAFMPKLAAMPGIASLAVQFIILTATRTGDVRFAVWGEIDETKRLWTIPAERMKTRKEHTVPLTDAALAILQKVKAEMIKSDFVFPNDRTGKAMSENFGTSLLKRMDKSDITIHGFRSTFRDWASEVSHYPSDVVEMSLAHTIKNKTEGAYRRGDLLAKRTKLMADWAAYCALIPSESGANVVQLREVAA